MIISVNELADRINSECRVVGYNFCEFYVKKDVDDLLKNLVKSIEETELVENMLKDIYAASNLTKVEISGSFKALAEFLISRGWGKLD